MVSIEKACEWLKATADDNSHGYSQAHRQGPDYDCSSQVLNALKRGGFDVNVNGYTGNMYSILKSIGFVEVSDNNCKKGDIYLTPGKHTVMAYADGKVVTAAGDKDGKTGDSSGKEIYCRDFYTPSYGWKYHMRYKGLSDNDVNYTYKVGNTYTLRANVAVRKGPSTNYSLVGYGNLTTDGKKHDTDKNGYLEKGTRVTCKDIEFVNEEIWIRTPSGWMCAYTDGETLIS